MIYPTSRTSPSGPPSKVPLDIFDVTEAAYTVDLQADLNTNRVLRFSSDDPQECTLPPVSLDVIPRGSRVTLFRDGAGALSFAPGAGVTLKVGVGLPANYVLVTLIVLAENEWMIAVG